MRKLFTSVFALLATSLIALPARGALISPARVVAEHNRMQTVAPDPDLAGVSGASGNTINGSGFTGGILNVATDPTENALNPNPPPTFLTEFWYVQPGNSQSGGLDADVNPEYLYYDLGQSMQVSSVVLWIAPGAVTYNVTTINVGSTTVTPATWSLTDLGAVAWTDGIADQAVAAIGTGQTFTFSSPVTTRYLRLNITGRDPGPVTAVNGETYGFNEFGVNAELIERPVISPVRVVAEHNRMQTVAPDPDLAGVSGASGNTINGSGFAGGILNVATDPTENALNPNPPPTFLTEFWYVQPGNSQSGGLDADVNPEYLYYDLGARMVVESVVLWIAPAAVTYNVTKINVGTTEGTPATWSLADLGALTWTDGIANQTVVRRGTGQPFAFPSPVATRYLRLNITGRDPGPVTAVNGETYGFNEFGVTLPPPAPGTVVVIR